jgi:hypothetical protein
MQVEALDLSLKAIKTESEVVKLDLSTEPHRCLQRHPSTYTAERRQYGDAISRFWVKLPKIDFL